MFDTKRRGSSKSEVVARAARPKSDPATPGRVTDNPLWHRIATRVQAKDALQRDTIALGESSSGGAADRAGRASGGLLTQLGTGRPLDQTTRSFFEPRFGRDLSQVRVHSGPQAAESARAIDAKAYTLGQHIVFGADRYAPDSQSGRLLLAHELTHVMQQADGKPSVQRDADDEKDPPKMSVSGDSERKSSPGGVAIRNGSLEWKLEYVGKDTEVTSTNTKDMSINVTLGRDVVFNATFTPQSGVSACPTTTFTQIVQPTIGGLWDTGTLLYTRSGATGASVDLNLQNEPSKPETEPFYSAGPRASGPGLEAKKDTATSTKPTMGDAPFQRHVPKGATAVRRFESAVICVETGETFGSISWGYTKTGDGVVTLQGGTDKDVQTSGASANFEPTRQAFYSGFFQLSLNDFGVGSQTLTAAHQTLLDSLDTKDLARIILVGANDNSGGPEAKADLSLKRAEAARDYLVKTRGVSSALIQVEGHGVEARLPNPSGQKVPENRRVDVHVQRGATTFKPALRRLGSAGERKRLLKQNPRLTVNEAVETIVRLDSTTGRIPMAEWLELDEMLSALDSWRRVDPAVPDLRQIYRTQLSQFKTRAQVITPPARAPLPKLGPISPEIDKALEEYEQAKKRLENLKRERDRQLRDLDQEYRELLEEE